MMFTSEHRPAHRLWPTGQARIMRCPDSSAARRIIGRSWPRIRAEGVPLDRCGASRRLLKRLQHRTCQVDPQQVRPGRGIPIRRADRRRVSVTRYNIFLTGEMEPLRNGSPWAPKALRSPGRPLEHTLSGRWQGVPPTRPRPLLGHRLRV